MTDFDALFAPLRTMPVPPAPHAGKDAADGAVDGVASRSGSGPADGPGGVDAVEVGAVEVFREATGDAGDAGDLVVMPVASPRRNRSALLSAAVVVVLAGLGLAVTMRPDQADLDAGMAVGLPPTVVAPSGGEVLFLGNSASYNVALDDYRGCEAPAPQVGGVFAQLGAMLDGAGSGFGVAPCGEQLLIGGRTLGDHRADPGVVEALGFSGAAVVVVQPDVYETLGYDNDGAARAAFLDNGAWLVGEIRAAGASAVLMEMWPERDVPGGIATTQSTVAELAAVTGADVVRVGGVMDRYRTESGQDAWQGLYDGGTHLSAKGIYLAALVHYRYLTGGTEAPAYRPVAVGDAEQTAMWQAVMAVQLDTAS